jgi:nitrite reductase/ring-hydroxylating ferredoxin subunit
VAQESSDLAGPDGTPVPGAADLAEGASAKFVLSCDGRDVDCFVVRFRGELHAFVNECRHVPMTMDWVENQFFTGEGDYLLCPTHGALYAPDTGECVAGPACGKSLFRVPLVERDGQVFALRPERPA